MENRMGWPAIGESFPPISPSIRHTPTVANPWKTRLVPHHRAGSLDIIAFTFTIIR